jgi:hypothetical protein
MKLPRLKDLINGFKNYLTANKTVLQNVPTENKNQHFFNNTSLPDEELIQILYNQEKDHPFIEEDIEEDIKEQIEENDNPLVLENPLQPFLKDYIGRTINHELYNDPNEFIDNTIMKTYSEQNRPMTRVQYDHAIDTYMNLKNFMHEDKAPILKKMWEDCAAVYAMFEPLKALNMNYTIDLTGGCVRDFILNKHHEIKDLDFMISLPGFSTEIFDKEKLLSVFSEDILAQVCWEDYENAESTKTKLMQMCVLQSQYKDSLDKVYCFHGKERHQIVDEIVYENTKSDKVINDRLVGVIKLNDNFTHYPIDFLLTDWIKPVFLKDFDFDICKASFCIYNPTYKKDFPKDYSHLISRFSADNNFWPDVIN